MSSPRRALVAVLLPKHEKSERIDTVLQLLRRDYQLIEGASPDELLASAPLRRVQALILGSATFIAQPPGLADLFALAPRRVLLVCGNEPVEFTEMLADSPGISLLPLDRPLEPLLGDLRQLISPRSSTRLAMSGLALSFELDGATQALSLIDLSNDGCAFKVDASQARGQLLPGTLISGLQLVRERTTVLSGVDALVRSVQVLPRDPQEGNTGLSYKVGVEFVPSPGTATPGADIKVEDPLRVQALINEALTFGPFYFRMLDDSSAPVHSDHVKVHDAKRLLARAPLPSNAEVGDLIQTTFELHGTSYKFTASLMGMVEGEGDRGFLLKMPRTLIGTRRRRSARFRPTKDQLIGVDVETPFGGTMESRAVVNITTLGLAFQIGRQELFPLGTILPRVQLRFPDGTALTCKARVRSLSPHGSDLKCGVEFETVSSSERGRLADAIVHAGQPDVESITGSSFPKVWDLFSRSGFLYPEKKESLDQFSVERTLSTLQAATNDVFKGSLFVRDGQPYAHISTIRAYSKTWIIHHLAATASGRQKVSLARLLNLAIIQYLEQQPDIEWIRVYYRPENPWPARTLGTFARKVSDSSLSSHTILHYLRGDAVAAPATAAGLKVVAAEPRHLHEVEAYFVGRRDQIALQAEDLSGPVVGLEEVSRQYAAIGLERRREILVAERNGQTTGFALLEISSPGLNLSELTSCFRVYMTRSDPQGRRALIAAARERYAQLGRASAVALAEPHELPSYQDMGMESTKRYASWTWHRSLYRHFFEYILGGMQKGHRSAEERSVPHGESSGVESAGAEDRRPRIVA
jgi:hypothetical protein